MVNYVNITPGYYFNN